MEHLIRKLSLFVVLSDDERRLLLALPERSGRVQSRTDLISLGEPIRDVIVLNDGWAIRHRSMADGRRQIVNFALPGDVAGMEASFLDTADYAFTTLTQAEVSWLPVSRVIELVESRPRLAVALVWSILREQAIFQERLVSLGRRSARERVAHLLCELWKRLQLIEGNEGPTFVMPVTQEDLADTLGLTPVHIYRTLRSLRTAGLVRIEGRRVLLDRPEELKLEAQFDEGYLTYRSMPASLKKRIESLKK